MSDRISDLPDEIMCHILSFLPTKQAVATSVLSKRWKPLWSLVLSLDFDYYNYIQSKEDSVSYTQRKEAYSRFVQSVSAVILWRDLHQPIKKFRLRCSSYDFCDPNDVRIWIHAVVQRRVEYLDICLPFQWYWDCFPKNFIISCSSLVVLKLDNLVLHPPSPVHFPALKILHMEGVSVIHLLCLSTFLSGCPILEDLKVNKLYYCNGSPIEEEFQILPKLIRAIIYKRDIFLLKAVTNVKFLSITKMDDSLSDEDESDTDEDIDDNEHKNKSYIDFMDCFPVFHNLTHIELNYGMHTDWIQVVEILKRCPKLQILVIDKGPPCLYHEKWRRWSKPQSVPKCISSHFTTCRINNYKGFEGEFQFASYIMQNARFLQTMAISCNSLVDEEEKFKMLKRLSLYTRRSAACKLFFE